MFAMVTGAVKDHPRVCGEQGKLRCSIGHGRGSPPRVRGTDLYQALQNDRTRITPACAGNSLLLFLGCI